VLRNEAAVNSGPTHLNFDGGMSKLDLLPEYTDNSRLSAAATVPVGFSDHRLVRAELCCTMSPPPVVEYTYRDLKRLNITTFRARVLGSKLWTSLPDDPDIAADQLAADLQSALDRCAPLCTAI